MKNFPLWPGIVMIVVGVLIAGCSQAPKRLTMIDPDFVFINGRLYLPLVSETKLPAGMIPATQPTSQPTTRPCTCESCAQITCPGWRSQCG